MLFPLALRALSIAEAYLNDAIYPKRHTLTAPSMNEDDRTKSSFVLPGGMWYLRRVGSDYLLHDLDDKQGHQEGSLIDTTAESYVCFATLGRGAVRCVQTRQLFSDEATEE